MILSEEQVPFVSFPILVQRKVLYFRNRLDNESLELRSTPAKWPKCKKVIRRKMRKTYPLFAQGLEGEILLRIGTVYNTAPDYLDHVSNRAHSVAIECDKKI